MFLLGRISNSTKNISNGYFCEFGAWDGKYLSNTYYLIKNKGYKAILIEGDENKVNDLKKNFNVLDDKEKTKMM